MSERIHDKGYKRILSVKENFLSLLVDFVKLPWVTELTAEDLELIDKEFIAKDFMGIEADVVYKVRWKGEFIYFYILLELQSTVDHTMPFRLLCYNVELLKREFSNADKDRRNRKDYRLPPVVPIVLYNGVEEWTAVRNLREYFTVYEPFEDNIINYTYILLNVNNYNDESLKEISNVIASVFILDKKQDISKMTENINTVLAKFGSFTADEQNCIVAWLKDVLLKKAGAANEPVITSALESLEKGALNMTYAIERLFDEIEEKGIDKGIDAGATVIKMLKNNADINEIADTTNLPLEKILNYKELLAI